MNGLSLFSGCAIGELAFKEIIPNYRTVGYVEWDKYCCRVIKQRIKDGILDDAPIWCVDIGEFNRRIAPTYKGYVDFVSGGPPCQPFSVAGVDSRGAGEADQRDCVPDYIDAVSILRPRYNLLENVPNIVGPHGDYWQRVSARLASLGYMGEWDIVPSSFVGAGHARWRVWQLADTKNKRCGHTLDSQGYGDNQRGQVEAFPATGELAFDARGFRAEVCAAEFVRTANALPNRVDRIRAIGNGWDVCVLARILQVNDR